MSATRTKIRSSDITDGSVTGSKLSTTAIADQLGFTPVSSSNLSAVATSGSYTDLTNKPTLFSGSYTDLTSKPTLFSGSYTDLTNKPTLFSGAGSALTGTTLASGIVSSSLTSVGTLTSLTTSGAVSITYTPSSITGSAITTTGKDTQGGTGFFDFLKVTNTTSGATNPNKTFRLNSTGTLQVLNSAYSASILEISDSGNAIIPGSITSSNSSSAFIAGSGAISGVALQMPRAGAIRDVYNGASTIYFDVSTGGSTNGDFQFRSSSSFTNFLTINSNGLTSRTPSLGKLAWNSAIDSELTIDNYRFRVSNQGGNYPQIISNTGGTVNTAWTAVAALSGQAIGQTGSTGILLPNGSWTSLYTSHGMDASGDTITVTLQDKSAGRIYRVTFMRSDSGSVGYNIIAERLL